jgi:hypothetical protein
MQGVDDRYRSDRVSDRAHSLVELVLHLYITTTNISKRRYVPSTTQI